MKSLNNLIGVIILFGIWRCSSGQDFTANTCVEKQAMDFVSKWRRGEKIPLDLPSIEVIDLPDLTEEFSGLGLKTAFSSGTMKLVGASQFSLEKLALTLGPIKGYGTLRFPKLTISGDNYSLKGRAFPFNEYKSSGSIKVVVDDVKANFAFGLAPQGAGSALKDLKIDFTLGAATIDLENSPWAINTVLKTQAKLLIMQVYDRVVTEAKQIVTLAVDQALTKFTPDKLEDTLFGVSNTCVEKQAMDFVSKWRRGEKIPLDLPSIEVIDLPDLTEEFSGLGLKTAFSSGTMKLVGASQFSLEKLVLTLGPIKGYGTLRFPKLTISGDNYSLKGRAFPFNEYKSSGSIKVVVDDVKANFAFGLAPQGAGSALKDLKIDFTLGAATIDLENSPWAINTVLKTQAKLLIMQVYDRVVTEAKQIVTLAVDQALTKFTPDKLEDTLFGVCKN